MTVPADPRALFERYRRYLLDEPALGLRLDVSRMPFPHGYLEEMAGPIQAAIAAMAELEAGAVANPDEGRRVGHYWLRDPDRAPEEEQRQAIRSSLQKIHRFSSQVHSGEIVGPSGDRFRNLLLVGIGGSALGPQLLADALGGADDPMRPFFFDNTDPDGFLRTLDEIRATRSGLAGTMVLVISKSGGTPETRNGMLEAATAYQAAGLSLAGHAVAVTGEGSKLHRLAAADGWLERFPMWDWVGGRCSITAAVGLLPARLLGFDIDAFLAGAREADEITRRDQPMRNPAAMMALVWHQAGEGRGARDMVVLPYKDRLALFSRYLQQLVMESLGKALDLDGEPGDRRLRQQGIDRPARLCATAAGRGRELLRHLPAGAPRRRRSGRGGAGHHLRRLPERVPPGHPPCAARERPAFHDPDRGARGRP